MHDIAFDIAAEFKSKLLTYPHGGKAQGWVL